MAMMAMLRNRPTWSRKLKPIRLTTDSQSIQITASKSVNGKKKTEVRLRVHFQMAGKERNNQTYTNKVRYEPTCTHGVDRKEYPIFIIFAAGQLR